MYKREAKKEMEKYSPLNYDPRLYADKYFGNDRGLSLQTVTDQGYTQDLASLMPLFNQYNAPTKSVEMFSGNFKQGVEGNKNTQMYLSENAKTFPFRYYDNKTGHSLKTIIKDRVQEGVIEGYNNYKRRPFRDGYKIIKKDPIRSGPYQYNRNDFGHSLKAITQAGGAGLAFSN